MKTRHLPIVLAAAAAFAAMPIVEGPAPFAGVAQAQGIGGGPGGAGPGGPGGAGGVGGAAAGAAVGGGFGGGVGASGPGASASAQGAAVASAAVDPATTGLDKAEAVLTETPADEEALDAVAAAQEEQQNAGATGGQGGGMSLGQAMGNMAEDAREALSAIFGGASQ